MEADEPIAQIETDKVLLGVLSFLAAILDASSSALILVVY